MARKQKEELNRVTSTVIGKDITIQTALITGSDTIRIDGTVIGNIDLDGSLNISDSGRVEGDLRISAAHIAGRVEGNVVCRTTLHMASTAVILGDITTAAFVVDKGAVLNGLCRTHCNDAITDIVD